MAESLVFNKVDSLIGKLASRAFEEASLAFGVYDDLRSFKATLAIVKGVLLDAEAKQDHTHGLREWLLQIKDVFSDAEDVLDEFECEAFRKRVVKEYGSPLTQVRHFLSSSNPLVFRSRMAHGIKDVRKRLDKVAADGARFGLERIDFVRGVAHRRETHSYLNSENVLGRDYDKEKIIDLLFQTHPGVYASMGLSVVSIVGIGGMGKTTLARLVFNDERIKEHFPLKMWVSVSTEFNIMQLMIKIIDCVSPASHGDLYKDQLHNHLKNIVAGNRFLLVLDDVWNEDLVKWNELRNLLQVSEGGRILVTTRNKKIAKMMGTVPFYELQGLSYEESLTMFVKWSFRFGEVDNYPNLMEIAKGIVRKCKGVPLTVISLACLLNQNFDEEKWKSVRDTEIWDQKETDMLAVLKLSYDQMPSYLRPCFSFFSLYPKDFEFNSIDVIELWVALGLLQSSGENRNLEDVAMQYLHELHSRCFLQDFMYFGYFYSFKIHDLMHDLAVYVTKDEFFRVNSYTQTISEKCRHLSIIENNSGQRTTKLLLSTCHDRKSSHAKEMHCFEENSPNLALFPKSKRVKTIMFPIDNVGLGVDSQVLLNKWLPRYKYLRVLDLSDSSLKTLPKSIGKLRFLRHLNLSFNPNIKRLPNSICELQCLQTLLLKGCLDLQALPKGLRKLISLRQLAITTMESDLSKIDIASLKSLQILSFEYCYHLKSLFGGIQQLTSLKELAIHDCWALNSLNFSIKHLPELVALSIVSCYNLELSDGHDNLETTRMKLRFVRFRNLPKLGSLPEWLQGAAYILYTLMIGYCPNLQVLPDWSLTFSQLNTLRIEVCEGLYSLPNNMNGFTALQRLEIVGCPELERKCQYQVGEYWPNISHLESISIKPGSD